MSIIDKINNKILLQKSVKHVVVNYFKLNMIRVSKSELIERLIEFEVVKNGEVDYISLNSIFDFYNEEFFLDKMKVLIDSTYKIEQRNSFMKKSLHKENKDNNRKNRL